MGIAGSNNPIPGLMNILDPLTHMSRPFRGEQPFRHALRWVRRKTVSIACCMQCIVCVSLGWSWWGTGASILYFVRGARTYRLKEARFANQGVEERVELLDVRAELCGELGLRGRKQGCQRLQVHRLDLHGAN